MPDIDIDFDDEGRSKSDSNMLLINTGLIQVAQIITYGKMAAKSAIRDTARVLELPLQDADRIAKLIPLVPDISLKKIFSLGDKTLKELANGSEGLDLINQLKKIAAKPGLEAETLNTASSLEGSVRNTGFMPVG